MKLAVEESTDALKKSLNDGLRDFNEAAMPDTATNAYVVTLRDDDGALQGGIIAQVHGESCYFATVWTADAVRGTGFGTKLMAAAEDEARRLGTHGVWLYTTSFQAKPFYEKLGYSEFAELKWRGSTVLRHFVRKDL